MVRRDQLQQLRATLRTAEQRQHAIQERASAKEAELAALEARSRPLPTTSHPTTFPRPTLAP